MRLRSAPYVLRVALFNAAVFFVAGVYLPFMPLWLGSRGLSDGQIAMVMATPQLARVGFTPLISYAADRCGEFRLVLRTLCLGVCAALSALAFSRSFAEILISFLLYAVAWTTIIPLTDAVAMRGVRQDGHNYGQMRLWGSLSFIAASAACGAGVQIWGAQTALAFIVAAAFGLVLASSILPRSPAAFGETVTSGARRFSEARAVFATPLFRVFLVAASAVQSGHALYYTFGTIHWQSQGLSGSVIGGLWTLGVLAEILLFAQSGRFLGRISPSRLILIGALAGGVRWTALAFDPPLFLLAPVQLLHAFTFGAAHLGAVHFIGEAVPERHSATAQGLYAALSSGVAMGIAVLASGPLYHAFGAGAYLAMAALSALSVAACVHLDVLWRRAARWRHIQANSLP